MCVGYHAEYVRYRVYMCRDGQRWCEWMGDSEKHFFCHLHPQPRPIPILTQATVPCAGNRYWLFREANLEPGYPQPLSSYGTDIPYDRIDTAIWWEPTGHTFFFQADR